MTSQEEFTAQLPRATLVSMTFAKQLQKEVSSIAKCKRKIQELDSDDPYFKEKEKCWGDNLDLFEKMARRTQDKLSKIMNLP